MCFSATASFAAAGVLGGIGIAILARGSTPRLRLLSIAPLLFGLQQAAEGVVWRSVDSPSSLQHGVAVRVFLGTALVVWPLFMPASLLIAETEPRRRAWLGLLLVLGAAVAFYGVSALLSSPSVSVRAWSLKYNWDSSMPRLVDRLFGTAYLLAAASPFLVSSVRGSRSVGVALLGAFAVSIAFWQATLPSVWCFFAALSSLLIVIGPLGFTPLPLRVPHARPRVRFR